MRVALVLAVLGLASPAGAHCYRTWNYPWAQRGCGVRLARVEREPQPAPARMVIREEPPAPVADDDHSWFVEFVLPDPDLERAAALEALRTKLNAEGPR
jgi:hypothetical protein